ncbi:ACP S-malonyltransferase [candidate division KSB1 bacterium]|nr:ACP S-malonyltransferase [candidate division KSB1 bacterium]NIR72058.1 ACP S-malonyltransferase [candidate division KSB1 bacterium]NIS26571.1 ACP S-malonyltransferase [candidate division KSB1 bacterium]NIT73333.1 ACP S-malonyltransferase [candidate division KSB1 bacterium]NIU27181.1 ACP S-malonyltransferase [candidate division KSB1 bacterium]
MTKFLVDHNIEGQAEILWGTLAAEGWLEVLPLTLVRFKDVGLDSESSDQEIWRFAQANDLILLTDNRNMESEDSLEQTIRKENTPSSFPVLTIGTLAKMDERIYRVRCATRIVEIAIDLNNFLGTGRLYIP